MLQLTQLPVLNSQEPHAVSPAEDVLSLFGQLLQSPMSITPSPSSLLTLSSHLQSLICPRMRRRTISVMSSYFRWTISPEMPSAGSTSILSTLRKSGWLLVLVALPSMPLFVSRRSRSVQEPSTLCKVFSASAVPVSSSQYSPPASVFTFFILSSSSFTCSCQGPGS
jgi:hypothetical protein